MSARLSPGFISLQLALVDRFVDIGAGSRIDGVHRFTNLQRRLGLGAATDPPSNQTWIDLMAQLDSLASHLDRVDAVMDAVSSLPAPVPEHIVHGWPTVGAFSVQMSGTAARTHFFSTDEDGDSPLHPSKLERRRWELMEVLSMVCDQHPELERIAGGSWLYSTRSYASLFPEAHLASAVVRKDRTTFRGMSHWGQFIDHRGTMRTALAERFRQLVAHWPGNDACGLFPVHTLEVESPIATFGLP